MLEEGIIERMLFDSGNPCNLIYYLIVWYRSYLLVPHFY